MRVSKDDPSDITCILDVYLNGILVTPDIIAADSDEGWVERYCRDEKGKIIRGLAKRAASMRTYGSVEIGLSPDVKVSHSHK